MATNIKPIPVLTGMVAKRFIKKANIAFNNKESIDFTSEIKSANNILIKSEYATRIF